MNQIIATCNPIAISDIKMEKKLSAKRNDIYGFFGLSKKQGTDYGLNIKYGSVKGTFNSGNYRNGQNLIITLIESGIAEFCIDGERQKVVTNSAIVLFPGQTINCYFSKDIICQTILAERDVYDAMISVHILPISGKKPVNYFMLDDDNYQAIISEIVSIKNLKSVKWKDKGLVLILRFKIVYMILKERCSKVKDKELIYTRNNIVHNFIKLIEEYFKKEITVNFYADKLSMHPNYLNILCKNHYNLTAKEMINNRIVHEAKQQLIGTDLTVKEIVHNLGFNDATYFTKLIKRKTGLTPSDYIKLREFDEGNI